MSADLYPDQTALRVPQAGPSDAVSAVARASDRGARIGVVVIALSWHCTIGLPATERIRGELTAPSVVLGTWLLVTVTGVVTGVRLLRGRPLPAWPLAALLLVVDVTVFAAVGREHMFSSVNWVRGTLGWFFVLILWERRMTALLGMLTAHALIALAALLAYGMTTAADLARYTMHVYGVSSLPVAVAAGSAALATLARKRAQVAATAHALAAEREAAEQVRQERRDRLGRAGEAAREVLAELADGRADPADPAVQRRCVLAAARLRRLIAESDDVPDPLLHELRAAADLAERNGLAISLVTIGTPPPLPVRIRRRLADPLTAALAEARDWARLTVVAGPDEVAVSLVTPDRREDPIRSGDDNGDSDEGDSDSEGDGGVQHLDERDGKIRWTQTRWRR
ncbi:hypothetical protein [Salinispora arenicola]|uniref:Signal transduction histidine kinase n=2 Tax=Salinispora arenicola TaxID=168697 RepID=A0A542XNH4_SALAC|nr:hypothetical protein [Salinispora arenicola]MCN0154093.1 hypothetical protein [Salinispora arenicola]TQL37394.1 hypothetical protein FB564_2545 [Salinispora arenicola]GIM87269.1 hypothetical protein Sar04_40050 [Salinispora arenicola]